MYFFTMWMDLAESTFDGDLEKLSEKGAVLRELVESSLTVKPIPCVFEINCRMLLHCSCSHNHRGDAHDRLLRILEWITEHLPGTHGLVYWYDDEPGRTPPEEFVDAYRVIVVAKGKIMHRFDPFLSPTMLNVEDRDPYL